MSSTTQTAAANSAQGLLTLVKGYDFHPYIEKAAQTGLGKKAVTGLTDNADTNPALILYPNPADGNVTILYTMQPHTNHNYIRVTDIVGRVVYEKNCDSTGKALELNTATFNNGTYFIELYSNKSLITTKTILINH